MALPKSIEELNAYIEEVSNRIAALESERTTQVAWMNRNIARRDDWGLNTPEGQASQADVVAAQNRINDIDRQIRDLRVELEDARAARTAINDAIASAVANGLDPDTAKAQAEADYERAQGIKRLLTYAGIGVLILLIVIAIIYFIKRRKG